jgi:hypothetical protein
MEPAYLFLEDHVYNFTSEEMKEIVTHLVRIEEEKDLRALGYKKSKDGIYVVSKSEGPLLQGGES